MDGLQIRSMDDDEDEYAHYRYREDPNEKKIQELMAEH